MHIIREVIRPGHYVFKVFNMNGALMYHGSSEATAIALSQSLTNSEKRHEEGSSVRTDVQELRG